MQHSFPSAADINNYVELGGGVTPDPLHLFYQPGGDKPEAFAWLTQPGVYYGSFNWESAQHKRELDHLTNHRLLPYSTSRSEAPLLPLAVVSPECEVGCHVLLTVPAPSAIWPGHVLWGGGGDCCTDCVVSTVYMLH